MCLLAQMTYCSTYENESDWTDSLKVMYQYFNQSYCTSHSAYVATETESNGAKINGLLPPSFGGVKGDFSLLRSDGGGTFRLDFRNLQKIWW